MSLQAQPTFSLPTTTVDESGEFEIGLQVSNFTDLITMQYTLTWDVSKLQFIEITNMNLQDMDTGTFGDTTLNTDQGLLPVAWVNDNLAGVTVPDGTEIFRFKMKASGEVGDTIMMTFGNTPTAFEVVDVSQNPIPLDSLVIEVGQIVLADLVNIENVELENIQSLKNYPNPFKDFTTISFDLKETSNIRLLITDLTGKEIYKQSETRTSGSQEMRIDGSIFPVTGEYIYQLQTNNNQLIGKLIFVK